MFANADEYETANIFEPWNTLTEATYDTTSGLNEEYEIRHP